jgi:hypothetical protein
MKGSSYSRARSSQSFADRLGRPKSHSAHCRSDGTRCRLLSRAISSQIAGWVGVDEPGRQANVSLLGIYRCTGAVHHELLAPLDEIAHCAQ